MLSLGRCHKTKKVVLPLVRCCKNERIVSILQPQRSSEHKCHFFLSESTNLSLFKTAPPQKSRAGARFHTKPSARTHFSTACTENLRCFRYVFCPRSFLRTKMPIKPQQNQQTKLSAPHGCRSAPAKERQTRHIKKTLKPR